MLHCGMGFPLRSLLFWATAAPSWSGSWARVVASPSRRPDLSYLGAPGTLLWAATPSHGAVWAHPHSSSVLVETVLTCASDPKHIVQIEGSPASIWDHVEMDNDDNFFLFHPPDSHFVSAVVPLLG